MYTDYRRYKPDDDLDYNLSLSSTSTSNYGYGSFNDSSAYLDSLHSTSLHSQLGSSYAPYHGDQLYSYKYGTINNYDSSLNNRFSANHDLSATTKPSYQFDNDYSNKFDTYTTTNPSYTSHYSSKQDFSHSTKPSYSSYGYSSKHDFSSSTKHAHPSHDYSPKHDFSLSTKHAHPSHDYSPKHDFSLSTKHAHPSHDYSPKHDFSLSTKYAHPSHDYSPKHDFSLSTKHAYPSHDYSTKYDFSSSTKHTKYSKPGRPLSKEDIARQKIANENKKIVESHQFYIDKYNVETVYDQDHSRIRFTIGKPSHTHTPIYIENTTTIGAAITSHNLHHTNEICILNFADAIKPGGGYLNGRGAQEEALCRQTLLYPTIVGNDMYEQNKRHNCKVTGSDIMIYSPNVYVIRDDSYSRIKNPFKVNIISSPAVDNREASPSNSQKLMESRIRKIVLLAASKRNDVLILGAFGCGVFKNDPKQVAQIFKKVLKDEGLKDHFSSIIFPIKDSKLSSIFRSIINS